MSPKLKKVAKIKEVPKAKDVEKEPEAPVAPAPEVEPVEPASSEEVKPEETHEETFKRINDEAQALVGKKVFANGQNLVVVKAAAKDVNGKTHVELFGPASSTLVSLEVAGGLMA